MVSGGLCVSSEVRRALQKGEPVVALETAVLTHGLPGDVRWDTYGEMMQAVREGEAVPAPVAVWEGAVWVGLEEGRLRSLCRDAAATKVGLADLPAVAGRNASGGTTVATTLWASSRVGIGVFATGGIGGVHRDAEQTFDISGDLTALAGYPGCVVCSGAKAILDLPKTVELLQTLGVCILGYRTSRFPAFVCEDSGLPVQHRVEGPSAAAAVLARRDEFGLPGSVLIVQPPPSGEAVPPHVLYPALDAALAEAERRRIRGGALTPFLLDELARTTEGRSVCANRALLVNNAGLAAEIARVCRDEASATPGA